MTKKQAKPAIAPYIPLHVQSSYDVIVIGAGPAGYSSAIRCAQLGLKTACIDNWLDKKGQSSLGGTYLNAGCVASIALLQSAKVYQSISENLKEHGIHAEAVSVNIAQMMQRKNNIINGLSRQIADSFAEHKIHCIQAKAKLLNERLVEVTPTDRSAVSISKPSISSWPQAPLPSVYPAHRLIMNLLLIPRWL